jgi:hypothetical protein
MCKCQKSNLELMKKYFYLPAEIQLSF